METTIKSFSQLGVKSKNLTGDKIEIKEVIDKQIKVIDYRVKDSKYNRDMCLTIQIEYEGQTRVIFSGSGVLLEDIENIPKDDFPFTTTIVKIPFKDDKTYFLKFT